MRDTAVWDAAPRHMSLERTWRMTRMREVHSVVISSNFMSIFLDAEGAIFSAASTQNHPTALRPAWGFCIWPTRGWQKQGRKVWRRIRGLGSSGSL
eukprot:jgi/Botrbrau1/10856/Bobra.0025s0034.1